MYPDFARVAEEENFQEIASVFSSIAVAERQHEKRYLSLLENIEKGRVFKSEKVVKWRCRTVGISMKALNRPRSVQRVHTRKLILNCLARIIRDGNIASPNRAYLASLRSAQILLRGTSDTLGTIDEIPF
jgi:hypothetical protein